MWDLCFTSTVMQQHRSWPRTIRGWQQHPPVATTRCHQLGTYLSGRARAWHVHSSGFNSQHPKRMQRKENRGISILLGYSALCLTSMWGPLSHPLTWSLSFIFSFPVALQVEDSTWLSFTGQQAASLRAAPLNTIPCRTTRLHAAHGFPGMPRC